MNLDANDLLVFARVIEAGSFSRAAERTGQPKSTLSRRIAALESRLGERLITRTTRHLALTDFGHSILEHARRLAEETDAAFALAMHHQALPQGTLRVSLPPDFHELELAPLFLRFASDYPAVRLELDLSARRVDLLAERFDLAVRVAAQLPDDNSLVARRVTQLQSGLYASPAYLARRGTPSTPADLLAHTALQLVGSSGEPQLWRLLCGAEHWEGLPGGPIAANSQGLLRTLAAHGLGIALLSERFARQMVDQGILKRLLPDWCPPPGNVWCVTPGRRLLPTRTRAFIDMLQDALASSAKT